MLDSHEGTLAQQAVLTFDSMHAFDDIAADPCFRHDESLCLSPSMQVYSINKV
jgi:hypothetical protein